MKPYLVTAAIIALLVWWFNLSPPAQSCFARGGTNLTINGACNRITVEKL